MQHMLTQNPDSSRTVRTLAKQDVKIYIPAEGAGEAGILGEDDVRLTWHATSVTVDLRCAAAPAAAAAASPTTAAAGAAAPKQQQQWRRLHVPELSGDIESAAVRRRAGKVVVTLVKKEATACSISSSSSDGSSGNCKFERKQLQSTLRRWGMQAPSMTVMLCNIVINTALLRILICIDHLVLLSRCG
eukprot:14376-Heterococcus_DN1.PRE.1